MIIGIDLGTSNSVVAYMDSNNRPVVIPNREGKYMTPSCVLLENEGVFSVGEYAKMNRVADSSNYAEFIKHEMGRQDYKFFFERGQSYSPEELSAIILRRLKEDAERFIGKPIEGAVITVPAYFDDAQRKATIDAANIAGIRFHRLINEPTAAALSFSHLNLDKNQIVAVYDLGGGTFDFSIIKIENGVVDVLGTDGLRRAGGFDIDKAILNDITNYVSQQHEIDLFDDEYLDVLQEVNDKIEHAKIQLSSRKEVAIPIICGSIKTKYKLTSEHLEGLSKKLFDRTELIMNITLKEVNLIDENIHTVLLVGGSTRLPYIRKQLLSRFDHKINESIVADEAVAMGAAIYAKYKLNSEELSNEVERSKICEISSHSLGIVTRDDETKIKVNSIILKRNGRLPASAVREFYTSDHNQSSIKLLITEGEDRDLEYVRIAGSFDIDVPPNMPIGTKVMVRFLLDEDQIIHISIAFGESGSFQKSVVLKRTNNLDDSQVIKSTDLISKSIIQ